MNHELLETLLKPKSEFIRGLGQFCLILFLPCMTTFLLCVRTFERGAVIIGRAFLWRF